MNLAKRKPVALTMWPACEPERAFVSGSPTARPSADPAFQPFEL